MAHSTAIRFSQLDRLPNVPDAGLCYHVKRTARIVPISRMRPCAYTGTHCVQPNSVINADGSLVCNECRQFPVVLERYALPTVRDHGALIVEPPVMPSTGIRAGALFASLFSS